MRRADRLFQLVQLLRARRVVTAEALAAELRVSKRTVYRDIRDLEASGVPVEGEAGVGYRLQRGFELPPMTFTPSEIEAIVLGARMVEAWTDPELGAAARSVLTKVGAVLPTALRPVLDETALFAIERRFTEEATRHMAVLRDAIPGRRRLAITYVGPDGARSDRTILPLGLYFWGTTWTLAAWCELRDDYRSFRPDRIEALAVGEPWADEGGPTLRGFLDQMAARADP